MATMDSRSTFPIPSKELLKEIWKRMKRHPMTWIPVAGLGGGALIGSALGFLVAAGAMLGGGLFWKTRWPQLKAKASAKWAEEHNEDQNDNLYRHVKQLKRYKCYDLSDSLKRFIYLKKHIERGLHESGELTEQKDEMEKLVDSLCFEVSDGLVRIADMRYTLTKGRRRPGLAQVASLKGCEDDLVARVEHAHQTLAALHLNLGTILDPLGANASPSSNSDLDGTIAKLKEETLIAQRVRRRIETDYGKEIDSEEATSARQSLME